MRVFLIDHYDSFTYNIVAWLKSAHFVVEVIKWDQINLDHTIDHNLIVLSPGPGNPDEYKLTKQLIQKCRGTIPIFGICLGMQLLLSNDDNKVTKLEQKLHGKTSRIDIIQRSIFKNLNSPITVARYHSLGSSNSGKFQILSKFENIIMAIEHPTDKMIGVQFHPESFMTSNSEDMAKNLMNWAKEHQCSL